MQLIGNAKPPTQILYGSPLHISTDELSVKMPAYEILRRVRRIKSGPVVSVGRIELFRYEIRTNGDVLRFDEDGKLVDIGPGDPEWSWVKAALRYRYERKCLPPSMWESPRPEDLVSLKENT